MAYVDWRNHAMQSVYDAAIWDFVDDYRPGRPTVVLLPGGMGSRLRRSSHSYQRGSIAAVPDNTVWFDLDTLLSGEARTLRIQPNGRDQGSHVIVPKGPLRFPVNAYNVTEDFFRHPKVNCNYTVFAYDWRRSLVECAAYLRYFLKELKRRVYTKHQEDPSSQLTLLAHSQGGLVATLFLHSTHNALELMRRLITVATPFYGNWSQHRRYYVGESTLSIFYSRKEMAEIISTLDAPYNLLFLPRWLFDRCGSQLGLDRYPLRDENGNDSPDPFSDAAANFYPSWVNRSKLKGASDAYRFLGRPLPDRVREHVYNLRSVADRKTPVELQWCPLPGDFDPDDNASLSPIQPAKWGLGDGTVPAWSAYHVSVPLKNRREFKATKDHTYVLEDAQILRSVHHVIKGGNLCDDPLPDSAPVQRKGVLKTSKTRQVLQELATGSKTRSDANLADENCWRGLYQETIR